MTHLRILHGTEVAPLEPLRGRTIAVLGYGHQGAAHAMNLRDSGLEVIVGNRLGTAGAERARRAGFDPLPLPDATARADLAIIALPDEVQPEVYAASISPHLSPGATIGFLHGFNLRYGFIAPDAGLGVVMVAPKGPGHALRARFVEGLGIPCLFAVAQESPAGDAEALGLAWARGIGCARAAIIHTTCADETETDLFGEQSVLCGGMTGLVLAAFEILVDAGYPPELAYIECCHELKQVADLVHERGLAGMMRAISNTAEFGAHQAAPLIVDEALRQRLRDLLARIRDGTFAATLRDDVRQDQSWLEARRRALREHAIEAAGAEVRRLMPWLRDDPSPD